MIPRYASTALSLDKTAYASLGTPGVLQTLKSFTLEAWVSLGQFHRGATLLSSGAFNLDIDELGRPRVAYSTYPPVMSPEAIDLSSFTYLAATWDVTTGKLVLYVQGLEVARTTLAAKTVAVGEVLIGSQLSAGKYVNPLQGQVGRVALWSVARTADEVLNDSNQSGLLSLVAEPDLELYVDFSILPAVDQSGNAIPLALKNAATYTMSIPGLQLGAVSCVDVGSGSLLRLSGKRAYTLEGWFYASGFGSLVCRGGSKGGGTEYRIQFVKGLDAGHGKIRFTRGTEQFDTFDTLDTMDVPLNDWYHFAATYNPLGPVISVYLDGNLQSALITHAAAPMVSGNTLIGASTDGKAPVDIFPGPIQSIRIWSEALAQDDIRQWLYNQPVTDPALLGAFDFSIMPPLDTTNQSAIGLSAASVVQQTVPVSPSSTLATLGTLSGVNAAYFNPRMVAPDPPPAIPAVAPQPELWSMAHRESSWQSILDHLPAGLTAERRDDLHARYMAAFETARQRMLDDPRLARVFTKETENGMMRLTYHGVKGDTVMYEGLPISDCQLWWMAFVFTFVFGFLQVFGIVAPTGDFLSRAYNLIARNTRALAALTGLVQAEITAWGAIGVISVLSKEGLLWPLLKLGVHGLGWWGLACLLKTVLGVITGVELAVGLSGIITWVAQLMYAVSNHDTECPPHLLREPELVPALA